MLFIPDSTLLFFFFSVQEIIFFFRINVNLFSDRPLNCQRKSSTLFITFSSLLLTFFLDNIDLLPNNLFICWSQARNLSVVSDFSYSQSDFKTLKALNNPVQVRFEHFPHSSFSYSPYSWTATYKSHCPILFQVVLSQFPPGFPFLVQRVSLFCSLPPLFKIALHPVACTSSCRLHHHPLCLLLFCLL